MRLHVITVGMLVGMTACGGGASMHAVPPASSTAPLQQKSANVAFRIVVPAKPSASARRAPRYVSTSTQSVTITVAPAGGSVAATATVNCTSVCTGQIAAPVGSDTFTANLYDAQNGAGNLLSTGTITQTITADTANTVSMTFNGVVASLSVALSPSIIVAGSAATITVTVSALDASGATIVGPGGFVDANGNALTISLNDADTTGATKLSATSITAPGTAITLSYNGSPSFSSATITASATGVTPGKGVLGTGCGTAPNTDLYETGGQGDYATSVSVFRLNAPANSPPFGTLNANAYDVAFDAHGSAYVLNYNSAEVRIVSVYCAGAMLSAAPVRTIVPPNDSTIRFGIFLAVDGPGNVYVPTESPICYACGSGTASLLVYAPGAGSADPNAGPTTVARQITGIARPVGQIGADSAGNVYVSDNVSRVSIYGPAANGNAPPTSQIVDVRAGLFDPGSTAVDAAGNVYTIYKDTNLANDCDAGTAVWCHVVAVTPPGGGAAPTHVFRTPSGWDPFLLAVNPSGTVAVLASDAANDQEVLVYPAGSQDGRATPSRTVTLSGSSGNIALDAAGNVYVGTAYTQIAVYPPSGAPYPLGTADRVAVTGDGTAYVWAFGGTTVNVYAPGATSSSSPIRTLDISGAFSGQGIKDLTVDAQGGIYIRIHNYELIAVFAPGASGTATPTRTFGNPIDDFDTSFGAFAVSFAADASGAVYVAKGLANVVNVYAPTASGTAASPVRQITYGSPTTIAVSGVALDARDTLYVASQFSDSIEVYPNGSSTPSRSIIGPNTLLDGGTALAVDPAGFIYATSANRTLVFAPNANGNVAPVRIFLNSFYGIPAIGPGP